MLFNFLFVLSTITLIAAEHEDQELTKCFAGWSTISGAAFAADKSATTEQAPEIPKTGKSVKDFIPAGWSMFGDESSGKPIKAASGDLNKDKITDYVFLIVKKGDNPTWGYHENYAKSPRPIIVLHGRSDGTLERACVSNGAIMNGDIANEFALAYVGEEINNGVITIVNGNSATAIQDYQQKYRYQNGKYELIGLTCSTGNTRLGSYSSVDRNLNTGYTTVEDTEGVNPKSGNWKSKKKYSYYSLRAGLVAKAPVIDDQAVEEEPCVNLENKWNLVTGAQNWKGATTLSGKISGVHTKSDLFIRAEITQKNSTDKVSLRLAGPKGKFIAPDKQEETQIVSGGTRRKLLLAIFSLNKLKQYKQEQYGQSAPAYDILGLSVQLVQSRGAAPEIVLSTSIDKEKHQGNIRLANSAKLATLENFDWKNCDW